MGTKITGSNYYRYIKVSELRMLRDHAKSQEAVKSAIREIRRRKLK